MTHYIGAVVVPADIPMTLTTETKQMFGTPWTDVNPGPELDDFLEKALARFDEGRGVRIWRSKAQVIAEAREAIEEYRKGRYAEYLADPEEYARTVYNPRHLEYLKEEFPRKLQWTDEEVYADAIKYEEEKSIREDGAVLDTYNPNSKWDWYAIGGRWQEVYGELQGISVADAQAALLTIENDKWWFPKSVVVKTGEVAVDADTNIMTGGYEWIAANEVGWFGYESEFNRDEWRQQVLDILAKEDQDARLVFIDFHI